MWKWGRAQGEYNTSHEASKEKSANLIGCKDIISYWWSVIIAESGNVHIRDDWRYNIVYVQVTMWARSLH